MKASPLRSPHIFVAMVILVAIVWSSVLVGCSDAPGAATSPSPDVGLGIGKEPGDAPAAAGDRSSSNKPAPDQLVVQPVSTQPVARTPQRTQSISFNDITFKMEKDEAFLRAMLTEKIEDYDGQPIRIRGFILPSFKQNGLTEFVLVRDNMECCFGPGAALYDCIMVRMQSGASTSFSVRPVTVEGTFRIKEWKDYDGIVRAIYHVDGKSVK